MCLLYLSLESNEKQAEEIGAKSTLENRKTSMGEIYTFVVFLPKGNLKFCTRQGQTLLT